MTLSRVIQALEPSATMAMAAKAKELKASGKTVYDLSLGEPDFDTPEHICDAAEAAIRAGHTHYTPASGIPAASRRGRHHNCGSPSTFRPRGRTPGREGPHSGTGFPGNRRPGAVRAGLAGGSNQPAGAPNVATS